ncbi:hypothetical protein Poly51_30780 [Rubripirellula tenax]|uniref:EF-hand domain-containing protein n=1 Tax=Rubripirellula tenax TaxID=2528015 RepID=A0A5C6F4H4_9BACT|nr:EF-hand domain-containing protein [Rubripirellula tenax]TWU54361.1 hypothetical protein Poly51_30780 [Rubripirellula tenax]
MNHARQCLALFTLAVLPCVATAQPPGRGGPPGQGGPGGRGGSPLEMMSQLFDQADANRDGSLTKAELQSAMESEAGNQRGGFQRGGNQQRPGGPPPQDGEQMGRQHGGEHGGQHGGQHAGAPPRPGQVLPDFMIQTLNLNEKQTKQLAALQADVDKRLAALLTDEQQQQLQNPPMHGPPGQGGQDQENGRPQRPQ